MIVPDPRVPLACNLPLTLNSISLCILNDAEVRSAFKLPRAEAYLLSEAEQGTLPENLMDTSVQYESINGSPGQRPSDPSSGLTSVQLTGFNHMGAGDVDCSAEE